MLMSIKGKLMVTVAILFLLISSASFVFTQSAYASNQNGISLNEVDVVSGSFIELYNHSDNPFVFEDEYGFVLKAGGLEIAIPSGTEIPANSAYRFDTSGEQLEFQPEDVVELVATGTDADPSTDVVEDTFPWYDLQYFSAFANDGFTLQRVFGEDGYGAITTCTETGGALNGSNCFLTATAVSVTQLDSSGSVSFAVLAMAAVLIPATVVVTKQD